MSGVSFDVVTVARSVAEYGLSPVHVSRIDRPFRPHTVSLSHAHSARKFYRSEIVIVIVIVRLPSSQESGETTAGLLLVIPVEP